MANLPQPEAFDDTFDKTFCSTKFTGKQDSDRVVALYEEVWNEATREAADWDDEPIGPIAQDAEISEDTGGVDAGLEFVPGRVAPAATRKRKVRRGRPAQGRFVRYWVDWGKAKFPNVAGSRKAADRECVARALVREMESIHVRYADIAKYKDRIVVGIMMPSPEEVLVAKLLATERGKQWQDGLRGWGYSKPRTWWQWLLGRSQQPVTGAHYEGV